MAFRLLEDGSYRLLEDGSSLRLLEDDEVPCDPFFEDVVLLLHADEGDGETDTVDSSLSAHAVSINDGELSDVPKFGASSIEFDGTDTDVTVAASADFKLDANLTVDFFARLKSNLKCPHFFQLGTDDSNRMAVHLNDSTGLPSGPGTDTTLWLFKIVGGTDVEHPNSGVALDEDLWYHIALVKDGDDLRLYLDGVKVIELNSQDFFAGNPDLCIGFQQYTPNFPVDRLDGYIDEFRITRGVRYTADFDPPVYPGGGTCEVPAESIEVLAPAFNDELMLKSYIGGKLGGTTVACAGRNANKTKAAPKDDISVGCKR